MIVHILNGVWAIALLAFLFEYARTKELAVTWWHWLLTVLGVFYGVFVLEVIVGFIDEGAYQAALINGLLTGFFAVVWAVLLGRFVFSKSET